MESAIHVFGFPKIAFGLIVCWTAFAHADDAYVVPLVANRMTIVSSERYGRRLNRLPQRDQDPETALPWKKKDGVWRYTPVFWEGGCEAGYPSIACPMAFIIFSDGEKSVCVSVEDAVVRAVQPIIEYDSERGSVSIWWKTLETGGVLRRIRGEARTTPGDWHRAVREYGERRRAFRSVAPHPAYVTDAPGMLLVILKQQNGEIIWPYGEFDRLADVSARLGLDYVGLFGWTRNGHDNFYPDYEPDPAMGGRVALVKGLELLRSRGIRTFLYANGQLQEREKTGYWQRHGRLAAQTKSDGTRYGETWHKYLDAEPHHFDLGCLSDLTWKNRMRGLAWQAHALGSDGLLYDQLGVGAPRTCFADGHGHVRGAVVYADERARFLKDIADEMRLVDPDFVVLTEGFHDSILDSCACFHGWGSGVSATAAEMFRTRGRGMCDWMPEVTKTAYPEFQSSIREPSPILTRTAVNYAALFGFKHELEVRYTPDRAYLERGVRPQASDYGTIRQKPSLTVLHGTDPFAAGAYLKRVADFQRKHREFLLRGRFLDTEGIVLGGETDQVGATRWQAADGREAVLVWNASDSSRHVSVSVNGVTWCAAKSPLPANSLRLCTRTLITEP